MPRVDPRWDAATVAAVKLGISLSVLSTGFVALSDDDFSRTVIAEQFARSPSLDPSGTSWLPLPFWIHGGAMAIFGRSLSTSHATAVVLGVFSAVCIHRAARWMRLSRPGAAIAAIVATGVTTAARLGVCAQPEALTAGLVLLGAAATRVDGSRRLAGALALFAACLCRYEAWAASAAFAAVALYDATREPRVGGQREVLLSGFVPLDPEQTHHGEGSDPPPPDEARTRTRRRLLLVCAAIALLAPFGWIAHGAVSHRDALFFLHRVAAYRRALGVTEPVGRSIVAYPMALFRVEPEVTLSAILVVRIAADRAPRALGRMLRPALVIAAVFAFLVAGRALDGAPTHHAERTLLPVWSFLAMFVAEGLVRGLSPARGRSRGDAVARAIPFVLGVALFSVLLRVGKPREPGAPRSAERAIGLVARRELAGTERLLVDTADYGYFAVIAAFGAPERAEPIDGHDPRHPLPNDPFATAQTVRSVIRQTGARWLVIQTPHLELASNLGTVVAGAGDLSLVRLGALR